MHFESTPEKLSDSKLNDSVNASRNGRARRTINDYEFVLNEKSIYQTSELGKGSYGTVKKVREKLTGKLYAMKIMNKKAIFAYSNKENLKREIQIQKGIDHPHVIRLYTYFEDTENVYLVMELAENGCLFQYLRKRKMLSEKEAFVYFFQTCLGIDFLHKRNIVHRDLKPENLLLDGEGNIKLCDFGWSAETLSKRQTFCGTIDYMAPEMIKNHPYDHRLDIWCLGILLYEMLHGYAPFKGRTDQEKCSNITLNRQIEFSSSISSEAVDLIKKILQPVPINRISISGIFKHPWMKKQERNYGIDIMSYVQQQDEQIRELEKAEQNYSSPKNSLEIKADKILRDSLVQQEPASAGTPSNAKIIKILDTSPLNISRKHLSEENKLFSSNVSTKESVSNIGDFAFMSKQANREVAKSFKLNSAAKDPNERIYSSEGEAKRSPNKVNGTKTKSKEQGNDILVDKDITGKKSKESDLYINQELLIQNDVEEYLTKDLFYRSKSGCLNNSIIDMLKSEKQSQLLSSETASASTNDRRPESRRYSIDWAKASANLNEKKKNERRRASKIAYTPEEFEDLQPVRLSKASRQSVLTNNQIESKDLKEVGFLEKILLGLGCIARDSKKISV